jgi:hypothetical protein
MLERKIHQRLAGDKGYEDVSAAELPSLSTEGTLVRTSRP